MIKALLTTMTLLSLAPLARANVEMSRLTGRGCTECHAASHGGTLNSGGRAFKHSDQYKEFFPQAPRVEKKRRVEDNQVSGSLAVLAGRYEEPFYEGSETTYRAHASLKMQISRLAGKRGLSFHTHLNTRLDEADREVDAADQFRVVTAYLRWYDRETSRVLKAGRQFITIGPRPFSLDGIDYFIPLGSSFDLDVFAGIPTPNGKSGIKGDYAAGGRFGWTPTQDWNVGLSANYQEDENETTYGLAGLDASFRATDALDLRGHVFYDAIAEEIYDILARASYELAKSWDLRIDYARLIPGSFLSKTSIFSVFSNEVTQDVTVDLSYSPTYALRTHTFIRGTFYETDENARTLGGGFDYFYGDHREGTVGADVSYTDEARNPEGLSVDSDVFTLRAFVRNDITRDLFAAVDLTTDFFGGNGYDDPSFSTRFHCGYRFDDQSTVVLGLDRLDSIQFDGQVSVSLKYLRDF